MIYRASALYSFHRPLHLTALLSPISSARKEDPPLLFLIFKLAHCSYISLLLVYAHIYFVIASSASHLSISLQLKLSQLHHSSLLLTPYSPSPISRHQSAWYLSV